MKNENKVTHEDLKVLKKKNDISDHDFQQKFQSLEDQIRDLTTIKADKERRDIKIVESKIKVPTKKSDEVCSTIVAAREISEDIINNSDKSLVPNIIEKNNNLHLGSSV